LILLVHSERFLRFRLINNRFCNFVQLPMKSGCSMPLYVKLSGTLSADCEGDANASSSAPEQESEIRLPGRILISQHWTLYKYLLLLYKNALLLN